jgi:hypothetical protein
MEHGKHYYYMSDFEKKKDGLPAERKPGEKPALTQDGARI